MKNKIYADVQGVVIEDEEEIDTRCGYGKWKPEWLQKLNSPKILLIWLSSWAIVQGNTFILYFVIL